MSRDLDRQLDQLEEQIAQLRILYEQYFLDIVSRPPDELDAKVRKLIRTLLNAPFKNSAHRFRLRSLIQRFQTYHTYWERVAKQREEGTYYRDLFKAEMREKIQQEESDPSGAADKGMRQLFQAYQGALRKSGGTTENLNFTTFKNSLVKKAQELKRTQGVKKISYKIVVKNGKVSVKAAAKE